MNNVQNQQLANTVNFTNVINTKGYKNLINKTLGDDNRAMRFISAITSAVTTNPALNDCDMTSIISGGFLGESLGLSPSPQLGQYYLVPFIDTKRGCKVAQFQLGYKGYIQLAIRSGQYKKLTVLEIKKDELISFNPLEEEIKVNLIEDEDEREAAETIGYYAMFEYHNGFRKAIYWSRNKMARHADKYSAAFSFGGCEVKTRNGTIQKVSYDDYVAGNYNPDDAWLYSSFWYKNFDEMAKKTMLRQLISKWGIMSIEMQEAFTKDMGVIGEDGSVDYADAVENKQAVIVQDEPVPAEPVEDEIPVSMDDI